MTVSEEKVAKCHGCYKEFSSDSPYHDSYCGDCRVYWYQLLKAMRSYA